MRDFEYYNPAKVVFGRESHLKTGELLKEYGGSRVLFTTEADPSKNRSL